MPLPVHGEKVKPIGDGRFTTGAHDRRLGARTGFLFATGCGGTARDARGGASRRGGGGGTATGRGVLTGQVRTEIPGRVVAEPLFLMVLL